MPNDLVLLRAVFTDDQTYYTYSFVGVFDSEHLIKKAKAEYVKKYEEPNDWSICIIKINEVM